MVNAETNPGGTSFAEYLAQIQMARKGYQRGTVPEARALEHACDIVLTRSDGLSFNILCIVDRESDPGRRFGLPAEAVRAIGHDCRHYAGKGSHSRLPVVIQIMEIGATPADAGDRARLGVFKRVSPFSKVHLSAWALAPADAALWTNAWMGGALAGRAGLVELMRGPRLDASRIEGERQVLLPKRPPMAAFAVLALLAVVFALEQVFAIGPISGLLAPSLRTLIALGGLSPPLVLDDGQWFRLFSAILLHGDAAHLAMNGFALVLAGAVLERLVGRLWFTALFVLGGLGGALMSLAVNPPGMVSVGASGAIMALLAAAFVCSFRLPMGRERTATQMNLTWLLVPALLPLAHSAHGQSIDVAAHVGGALTGAAMGWVLGRVWPRSSPLPGWRMLAAGLCAAGLCVFAFSAVTLAGQHRAYALSAHLVPPGQLPATETGVKDRLADLLARYPRDPRLHWLQAKAFIGVNDYVRAESSLRAGLAEQDILDRNFSRDLGWQMRGTLALILAQRGQMDEARSQARTVCAEAEGMPVRNILAERHLCD